MPAKWMLFMLPVLMGTNVMADLIVTVPPSTVAAWPIGTSFEPGEVGETTNFLGPFSGTPIEIRGWDVGGSQTSLDGNPCSGADPCLEFIYDLTFSSPTEISSVSFTGDAFNNATFLLINADTLQVNALETSTGNVGHPVTETLTPPAGDIGEHFVLELFDGSSAWTYVSDINVSATPEPSTVCFTAVAGMVLIGLSRRKRLQKRP